MAGAGLAAAASPLAGAAAHAKPPDATELTELGHAQFVAGDLQEAEASLLRALELQPGNPLAAEDLGRMALVRADYISALRFFDESLGAERDNQAVWFLRADAAMRAGDWKASADSLESGLGLGGDDLPERTRLVRLYLEHNLPADALRHVRLALPSLPRDAKVSETYAEFLEQLKQPDEALDLWHKTLAVAPKEEPAYFAVARLLYDKGDREGAMRAADRGLAVSPSSARLSLLKVRTLEDLGRPYEARRTLRAATNRGADVDLLRREAEVEDQYGMDAAESYKKLVLALEGATTPSPDLMEFVQRGLVVSLRDRAPEQAAWFEARLEGAGRKGTAWSPTPSRASETAVVPGGMRALLFVVQGREHTTAARFFVEYARAVVNQQPAPALADAVADHFRRVVSLQALGARQGDRVAVTLSTKDKEARKATGAFLKLMGWEIRSSDGRVSVEAREDGSAAERQLTVEALGIDTMAMQRGLESSGIYRVDLDDQRAPVLFGEAEWRAQFYAGKQYAGGFAQALADNPQLARLYAGLADLDRTTAEALVSGLGLKSLAEKYSDLTYGFAPALAVNGGRVVVPGGPTADHTWQQLAGASPTNPGSFLQALFRKDDGKLLAFFATLSQLDSAHQRFFMNSAERTAKFYELFKDSPDLELGAKRSWRAAPFIGFLADVPLDRENHVHFPGGPEVWMVAKGQSSSAATGKILKKLSRVATPDVEDEILLRLARTAYTAAGDERSQLDNFLAVVHLEAHRREPLDEASALILAQAFPRWEHAWPYLSLLTGLGREELTLLAPLEEKLGQLQGVELNVVMGQVHALLELLCLARQSGSLTEKQSTELFVLLSKRYLSSDSASAFAAAGLDVAQALLEQASASGPFDDADAAMRTLLLGPSAAPATIILADGVSHEVDGARERHASYRQVLELQRVPSLQSLLRLREAEKALVAGTGDPNGHLRTVDASVATLPDTQVPKTVDGVYEDTLKVYGTRKIQEATTSLGKALAKRKVKPEEVREKATELLAELNPAVTLGLAGLVYAYYLSPEDLLVSEDPLLLRKHQFVGLNPAKKKTSLVFLPTELEPHRESGSWPQGGLAEFSALAGKVALTGMRRAEVKAQEFIARQVGSLRSTRWDKLQDADLRLVGLKVRAGREWIVEAALNPDAADGLLAATLGQLSVSRRSELLRAASSGDWEMAWESVTLGDLYFLGDEYLHAHESDAWPSPTLRALRELARVNDGAGVQWLGADLGPLFNCSHPHLLRTLPYEHYERFMFPDRLAIRSGEFKLYLAEFFDREAVPATAMQAVAEPLARRILGEMRLADLRDWPSTSAAYAGLNPGLLQQILEP